MELTRTASNRPAAGEPGLDQVRRLLHAVANTMAEGGTTDVVLQRSCQALVDHLGAAFARIWTLDAGAEVLRLRASAGMYTRLNGQFAEVPLGELKIGQIAAERRPHLTNDVEHDPRVRDHGWARTAGMVAFAGHPLVVETRVLGVMALFATHPLAVEVTDELAFVAGIIAQYLDREMAAANERRRLAQELHDTVSQGLYGISLAVKTALRDQRLPPATRQRLHDMLQQTEFVQAELRGVMVGVQPGGIGPGGLGAALEQLAASTGARYRVPVATDIATEPEVGDDALQTVYRIAQEALANGGRHAHAGSVRVGLAETGEGRYRLTVEDDGIGFDPGASRAGHLGLGVMAERAAARGWLLEVGSRPGAGTTVSLTFGDLADRD